MTDTPRLWDRRADETPKSYAAFLAYVALGARRSVREAARQHCVIWAEKYDGEEKKKGRVTRKRTNCVHCRAPTIGSSGRTLTMAEIKRELGIESCSLDGTARQDAAYWSTR